MWNKPTVKQLQKIPLILSNEFKEIKDTKVYMHFFLGGCDWYITEFDGKDLMYGFGCLNDDRQNAEWGYVSLKELLCLKISFMEVDRDKYFKPCKAKEIPLISECMKW